MAERFPSDETARVVVRCGEDLRDRLNARAKLNGRSANSEALAALEFWLSDRAQAATREPMSEDEVATIGEALGRAIASSPKLLKRFGVIDALVATGQFEPIAAEDGRRLGPDDLMSSVGPTTGPGPSWPPRIDGGPVSPEEQARRDEAIRLNKRLSKRSERA